MSQQIPVKTRSGDTIYVEIEGAPAAASPEDQGMVPKGTAMGAAERLLDESLFERVVGVIRGLVEDVGGGLMKAEPKPAQVELEIGLGLGASGNVVIFKGDANATFKLKMTWKS